MSFGNVGISSEELERLTNNLLVDPQLSMDVNFSDIEALIERDTNGLLGSGDPSSLATSIEPHTFIVEQPRQRGLRFRYECEGRSAGSIPGVTSTDEKRKYPTIRVRNHHGPAVVVVSCVTMDKPHKPHPHSLVGKDCKAGVCTIKIKDCSNPLSFPNLGIQCAKKKDVQEALSQREKIRVDPFRTGFAHRNSHINLNVVRLCFQAFLPDGNGKFHTIVPPVASQAIYDKKAVNDLKICRVTRVSGTVLGGDEVTILCEKVQKEDIRVRFFQESIEWESFGTFGHQDVHKQVAITFKTPAYRDLSISAPQAVSVQLYRPSDTEGSDPITFSYTPDEPDPDGIGMKRKRKDLNFLLDNQSAMSAKAMTSSSTASQQVKDRIKAKASRKVKQENTVGGLWGAPSTVPAAAAGSARQAAQYQLGQMPFDPSATPVLTQVVPGQAAAAAAAASTINMAELNLSQMNQVAPPQAHYVPPGGHNQNLLQDSGADDDLRLDSGSALKAYLEDPENINLSTENLSFNLLSFGETETGLTGDLMNTDHDPQVAAHEYVLGNNKDPDPDELEELHRALASLNSTKPQP